MLRWLKQLFCNHIWRIDKVELLGYSCFSCAPRYRWKLEAVHQTCVRCGAKRITKQEGRIELCDERGTDDNIEVYKERHNA